MNSYTVQFWFINRRLAGDPLSFFMEDEKLSFYEQRTIKWNKTNNTVVIIDQTLLPNQLSFVECTTVPEIIDAIKTMKIRGAPAIGVAGAMGVVLSVLHANAITKKELLREIEPDLIALKAARPTAVNLSWGVDQAVEELRDKLPEDFGNPEIARRMVVQFVEVLADSDVATNKKLSDLGAKLFHTGDRVLTHCN
jgi:methylthioribose-1-phosphate isomerase